MISITVNSTQVESLLKKALYAGADMEPILRAAGTTLLSITRGTFTAHGAAYRPLPWPPKKDCTPSTLRKSGTLWKSLRLTVRPTEAVLSNPMPYAAIHQFGGRTPPHTIVPRRKKALAFDSAKFGRVVVRRVNHPGSNIPARPFVPITQDGGLTPAAEGMIARAVERALARQIGAGR